MIPSDMQERIHTAACMIRESKHVIAFTGAGISTPSGIPDFRGEKDGLWQRYDPMQVASHTAFINNPALFFDWFRPLFLTSWKANPNPAHFGLAALEKAGILKAVITQNIDGLHQKAGSKNIYELHGSALSFKCSHCDVEYPSQQVFEQFESGTKIPRCDECQTILKPDVVLFEEPLPEQTWLDAEEESDFADLIIIIGSSLEVYPASSLPRNAINRGCQVILNNLSTTPIDRFVQMKIPIDTAELIPLLVQELRL